MTPTIYQIETRLYDLIINKNEAFAVLIKGEWGTGKTYFWKSFVAKYLQKKQVAYISLYGHQSIQDIKTEILLQIAPRNKKIKWIQDKIKNITGKISVGDETFNIAGSALSSLLSVLQSSDFKEVVICFDDFERISNKLDLKDVLGLISMLKEQKKCKIVMILNDKELEDIDNLNSRAIKGKFGKEKHEVDMHISGQNLSTIFAKYHDKTVDYEFVYNPSIKDSFELVKGDLKCFDTEILYTLLTENNITNIRVLKRVINDLNEFVYLQSSNFDKKLFDGLLNYIFVNSVKVLGDEYYRSQFGYIDEHIRGCVDEYFKFRILYKNCFNQALQEAQNHLERYSVQDSVRKLYFRYCYDFSYTPQEYVKEAFAIIQAVKDNIVKNMGYEELKSYIDSFIELDPTQKSVYSEFLNEHTKIFLSTLDYGQFENRSFESRVLNLMSQDPTFNTIIEQRKVEYYAKQKASVEEVIALLRYPQEQSGWGNKQTKGLASISSERYEELMKESANLTEEVYYFMKFTNGFGGEKPFAEARKNIIDALKSIAITDVRAKKLLKKLNIREDDE